MAKKRNSQRQSIFVTNEYFERCGISRQVVRYRLEKGDIRSAGEFKGLYLYYQRDADFLILEYWIDNYKKYLLRIYDIWQGLLRKEPFSRWQGPERDRLLHDLLNGFKHVEYLDQEFYEFKKLVLKYHNFTDGKASDENDPLAHEFSKRYVEGIAQRNWRYRHSGLSPEDFIIQDNLDKHHGKTHLDIEREVTIRTWFEEGRVEEIENLLDELRGMKGEGCRETYDRAIGFYRKLKRKRGQ